MDSKTKSYLQFEVDNERSETPFMSESLIYVDFDSPIQICGRTICVDE